MKEMKWINKCSICGLPIYRKYLKNSNWQNADIERKWHHLNMKQAFFKNKPHYAELERKK